MPPTYCQIEESLANARQDVNQARQRLIGADGSATTADNALAGLASIYSAVMTEIVTKAAANPNDDAWQVLLARKNLIVAEKQTLKAETAVVVACFDKVAEFGAAAVQAKLDELI